MEWQDTHIDYSNLPDRQGTSVPKVQQYLLSLPPRLSEVLEVP